MENPSKIAEADPFGSLPDPVLLHIVSLLSYEDAGRAPAISKRWNSIWPCSRKVVLDERPFTDGYKRRLLVQDGRNSLAEGIKRTGRRAFVNYARRFAARYREPKIDHFTLRLSHPDEYKPDVSAWVRMAADRAVEVLELDFSDPDLHHKSPEGYTGYAEVMPEVYQLRESLHSLKLSGCHIDAASLGELEALRVLSLARAELPQASLELLIRCCKHLEELSLLKLSSLDSINIVDRNRKLERLTIEECRPAEWGVTIQAPRLRYLKYSGYMRPINVEVEELEEADIDFCLESEYNEYGDLLAELLVGVGTARVLTVCSYITQVIASGEEPLHLPAPIGSLRHLIFKRTALHRDELPGVALLLRSYPRLESLTFEMGDRRALTDYEYPFTDVLDGGGFWRRQVSPIPCLRHHLRTVRMEGFKGGENEMATLQFLLGRARALQEVIVNFSKEGSSSVNISEEGSSSTQRREVIAQVIHGFNKASPAVQIVIS